MQPIYGYQIDPIAFPTSKAESPEFSKTHDSICPTSEQTNWVISQLLLKLNFLTYSRPSGSPNHPLSVVLGHYGEHTARKQLYREL